MTPHSSRTRGGKRRAAKARPFRQTSFSVYPPDGTRCRGTYCPGESRLVGIHVHGFRSSSAHRKAQFFLEHALQNGYGWVNFDLPCHGRSEGRFRDFRVSNALDALLELLAQFRGTPVMLLGSSMGAWLAMLAAQVMLKKAARSRAKARAATIAGAVLIAPAFDFFRHYFQNQPPEVLRQWRRDGVRDFTDHYDGAPYQLDYAALEDGVRHSALERAVRYDFPIRIFHGARDEVVPLELSRQFQELSPEADINVRVIKNGGHSLDAHLNLIAAEVDNLFARARATAAA
ncbi:MAG: alpha/beta hydrolase [Gammaproteobacteria bacterium]|nr:alpha/beta hydrolase [Gammaproteobacteria bacterium]